MNDLRALQRRLEQLDSAPRSISLTLTAEGLWRVSIVWNDNRVMLYDSATTDREAIQCALNAALDFAKSPR